MASGGPQLTAAQCDIPAALREAIADVRSDKSATNWCLAGFVGDSMALSVVGSGSGGVSQLREKLTQDGMYYGLVRTTEQIDSSSTVKFVYITFLGSAISVMRRAKISTLKGTVTEAFEPFHAEMLNATSVEEVNDEALTALLHQMFGNAVEAGGDADTMRIGQSTVRITQKNAARKGSVWSDRQKVEVAAGVEEALRDVRSDATPTNWMLSTFSGEALSLVGSGSGGAAELAARLSADGVYYGLVRLTEQIDSSATVKFVFISFLGEQLGVMQKAKMSTLKGTITETFTPFHTELINASSADEVTDAALAELVGSMFGKATEAKGDGGTTMRVGQTTVKITAKNEARGGRGCFKAKQVSAWSGAQKIDMPADLTAAIKDVRNDKTATNWCLAGNEGDGQQVAFLGSGDGGSAELAPLLKRNGVYYGLLRTTERIDASETVKFVFFSFLGEDVGGMRKAKVSTVKGTITEWFAPFHLEIMGATSADDISSAAVEALLAAKSGKTGDAGRSPVAVAKDSSARQPQYGGVISTHAQHSVPPEVAQAIRAVRTDAAENQPSWCLLGYDNGATPALQVVGTGKGHAEEMQPLLDSSQIMYALVRLTQLVDRSTTVKFAFISWVGDDVAPMRKAKLSTLRGEVASILAPVHTELLNVTSAADVSNSTLMRQLEGSVSIN